jgi:hypothetical protein
METLHELDTWSGVHLSKFLWAMIHGFLKINVGA